MANITYTMVSSKLIKTNGGETFGALLRDKDLNIVREDNIAKMYNIVARPKPETAVVRDFNLETLDLSETSVLIMNADSSGWASVHYALKIDEDFYILFFTTESRTIRAAISSTYNGLFSHIPTETFNVIGDIGQWDSSGIEQDVGARKISEDEQYIYYRMLYSNTPYLESNTMLGQNGWYKIRVDKINKTVEYLGKYENNPLTQLNQANYNQNRVGGSNTETMVNGKYLFFHMLKNTGFPDEKISLATSDDPMFNTVDSLEVFGDKLNFDDHPDEYYMEKFEYFLNASGQLVLIYEDVFVADDSSKFGVGSRTYEFDAEHFARVLVDGAISNIEISNDESPFKIFLNNSIKNIPLVDVSDPKSSDVRIFVNGEIKTLKKI